MQDRLTLLRLFCKKNNIDAALISVPANITYLTTFSFSLGTDREAFVFVTPKEQYIISSHLYKDEILQRAPHFTFIDFFSDKGGIFWKTLANIVKKEKITTIGFEEDNFTVAEYETFIKYHEKLVGLSFESIREEKDKTELSAIKKACTITDNAFTYIIQKIKPPITERELAYYLDDFIRRQKGIPSFPSIIAFGKNSAVPHHATNDTPLQEKDCILLDFGVQIDNYCSDMTRTIFLGKPTSQEKKIYETVRISQQKALDFLQRTPPPISAKQADTIARRYVTEQKYPSFPHSLGHSIGINVHDGFGLSPYSKNILKNGMVFSVEPGIYISGRIGVRIEDTVALNDNILEILTTSTKELIVL